MHLVADVRTVCVTLPHQRQAVPFRRTALQPHLRVVEVQQQPAEYQLHARTRVGQSALPEERAVGVGRYVYRVGLVRRHFSALTLLVGRQEGHPACKKLSGGVLAWSTVWSEVQTCIWPS